MASDQGKWFKLHIDWDDDPHIDALNLEDQVRWVKFGTYTKKHGTEGKIVLVDPCRVLQNKFRVNSFHEVVSILKKFPNYDVREEDKSNVSPGTFVTVSILNWHIYQGDLSTDRVRNFRTRETGKRRGEEKRGDEKRRDIPPSPPKAVRGEVLFGPEELMALWNNAAHIALARVRLLPKAREAVILERLKTFPTRAEWERVIEKVNASPLLIGQKTKWRATFDWILNASNLTKIIEGNYDDASVTAHH